MSIVDELRHLDNIQGGTAVNEKEYMATNILHESKPLTQVVYLIHEECSGRNSS